LREFDARRFRETFSGSGRWKGMKLSLVFSAALLSLLSFSFGCTHPAPLPPKALELNRDGAAALAAGDLTTAEARLAVALEYNPRFTEAWVNLGLVELRRGNLELARKHLSKARDLNPDLPTPHHGLGLVADARGRGAEAEKHYREALKVDPGFAPARANLGRRLFARGAFEEAREQFLRLTEVVPESGEGWLGLAESLLRLERYAEADDAIARGRARVGDTPALMLLVARRSLAHGAFAEAVAILEPITHIEDRPRAGAAWAWLAVARAATGDAMGARACAIESLRVDADDSVARYVMDRLAGSK
jgi:tetratricopeptide (TPR) repeat protein